MLAPRLTAAGLRFLSSTGPRVSLQRGRPLRTVRISWGQLAGWRCGATPAPQHATRCIIHFTLFGCALASSIAKIESPSVSNARAALRPAIRCFFPLLFCPSGDKCRGTATVQGQGFHGARRCQGLG